MTVARKRSPSVNGPVLTVIRQHELQAKFADARAALQAALIERDDEIDLVLTALIAQEHPLLVGPPGTGKSLLGDSLLKWMGEGCCLFSILFTKFTTPEEVFGPVSVNGLKADRYVRITTGKLPEAVVGFADEVFKASSAILNTMLRILNERTYENGDGTFRKCPLRLCIAASNEWPQEQNELGALFDRFLFRKTVRPIATAEGRRQLLWVRDHQPKFTTSVTPAEIDQAHTEALALTWKPEAMAAFEKILAECNREGVFPGDRRQYKSVTACQAYAYLAGARAVETEHLEILAHTLWDEPNEQPKKVGEIVARIANPVGMQVGKLLSEIEEQVRLAATDAATAVKKLQGTQRALESIRGGNGRVEKARAYCAAKVKEIMLQHLGVTL